MRIITPKNIDIYSRCPQKAYFSWDHKDEIIQDDIVISIIKEMYLNRAKKGKDITWRQLPSLIDKYLVAQSSKLLFNERYKENQNILSKIHKWYHKYYIKIHNGSGIINVPIRLNLSKDVFFVDSIDIVEIGDQIRIFDIKCMENSNIGPISVYNDISMWIKIWGFYNASKVKPNGYVRLIISPKSIKVIEIKISDIILKKADKMLKFIIMGIIGNIFYPSISSQCTSCPFKEKCSF